MTVAYDVIALCLEFYDAASPKPAYICAERAARIALEISGDFSNGPAKA